jgi:hypothetical protein
VTGRKQSLTYQTRPATRIEHKRCHWQVGCTDQPFQKGRVALDGSALKYRSLLVECRRYLLVMAGH